MRIDVIIPNFNGSELIQKNLPFVIQATQGYDYRILIVDDASREDDIKRLKDYLDLNNYPNVQLVEHKHNTGFAGAINTGIKNSTSPFIVLLNSDVKPRRDFLKSPIERLTANENLFGIGCMDESIENGKRILRGRGVGYWSQGMLLHKKGEIDKKDTFWISGGSSIIRRDILEKIGGMDELYAPFYWEDIDLSYRARKAGYTIEFDHNSIVEHYHFEGSIKKNFNDSHVQKIAYRNQFIFIWKNITDPKLLLSHFLYLPFHIARSLIRADINMLTGLFLALSLLPAIIGKRRKQKKYSHASDRSIIFGSK